MSSIQYGIDLSTMEKFKYAMEKIKSHGYYPTHRTGPTGIGKTLEDLLQISENNSPTPDLGHAELKAARYGSDSMLTLLTLAPDIEKANSWLVENYGYSTPRSMQLNPKLHEIHTTLTGERFNTLHGQSYLKLSFNNNRIYIEHATDGILENVFWSVDSIRNAFNRKYPKGQLYYVLADKRGSADNEEFYYKEAYCYSGFNFDNLCDNIYNGTILIDIRIGIYSTGKNRGQQHDHGTGLRILPSNFHRCFCERTRII